MSNRHLLCFLLALIGYGIGTPLEALKDSAELKLQVGSQLVCARWNPKTGALVGAGRDSNGEWFFRVWNREGREILPAHKLPAPPRFPAIAWHPAGHEFAIAAGAEVWVVDIHSHRITRLKAAPSVRHLEYKGPHILARSNKFMFLWDSHSKELKWSLNQPYLLHAAIDESGERIALNSFTEGVDVYEIASRKKIVHLEGESTSCGLRFTNGGQWLTIGLRNSQKREEDKIKTYDFKTKTYAGPALSTPNLLGFDVSCDGSRVLTRMRGRAVVWDTLCGQQISQRSAQALGLDSISGDGRWALSSTREDGIFLWDCRSGEKLTTIETERQPSFYKFETRGDFLVVDQKASVWTWKSTRQRPQPSAFPALP